MKRVVSAGVKGLAIGYDAVRPPDTGVVALAYHRVGGGSELAVDLDPGLFAAQMEYLASSCDVWSIDHALDELEKPSGSPAVVVTFDDGTADFVDHALPALVANNVPATYYIATEFIDKQTYFPNDGKPMTWAAVAEAASTGLVTFGSHTHTHAVMDKLSLEQVDEELRISCEMIEDRIGGPVEHFAYPKGVFGGAEAEPTIARYVRSAALAEGAANPYGKTNPLRLDRSPIQTADGMRFFEAKVRGGLRLEGLLRARLNGRRYVAAYN